MKWPEITAMWLRERARKLREKADAIDEAYKSNAIRKYTSQVAGAYYTAAFDFEQLADQLEKENNDSDKANKPLIRPAEAYFSEPDEPDEARPQLYRDVAAVRRINNETEEA